MDYFKHLLHLLHTEKEADRNAVRQLIENVPVAGRREAGLTWYPIAIREVEISKGDYLTIEVERTAHADMQHQLRFGMSAAIFSNYNAAQDRLEGIITHISSNRLKLSLRVDELPDWSRSGKLGIDAVFDENSYAEMEAALKKASEKAGQKEGGVLIEVLTGSSKPRFQNNMPVAATNSLNSQQQAAVQKIIAATDLAIVHGPPGTGKTTTLVQAIKAIVAQHQKQVLVTAPSNTAVDLLSEKLSAEGLAVVRVGNPARVNERQMALTLDSRMAAHSRFKEIKKLKKQAAEYRDLAQKYKRSFGKDEREQRKALFAEARSLMKEVERTEAYIAADVLSKAQVITATLVGANHYTIKHLRFETVFIDEAGQALEPACWIPVLKAQKVVMAGDHCQLPPVIKSLEAAAGGLRTTLMEKCVALHPEAVVLLEEQYRMNKMIMGFSSQQFYESKLQAHHSVAERSLFEKDSPLVFIDTAGCSFDEKQEGTSIFNPEEAYFLLRHLNELIMQVGVLYVDKDFPSVAVISPYKHQVAVLKELVENATDLLPYARYIQVNTIDSFQGQERDIVYISMTRSNSDGAIGFLSDIRRMNVAMTRARKKLVIIGDSATLAQDAFYADFIEYAQGQNAYVSAWEFMDL